MKFAICNETFKDWPLDRALAFAVECGYTGLEIAPFTIAPNVNDISASKRDEIRHEIEQAGLEVIGLHWLLAFTEGFYLTSPDAEVRANTSQYLRDLGQFCHDLGGDFLVFGSPVQRNLLPNVSLEEGHTFAAEVIRAVMPALEELNVTLAMEPLGPAEGDFLVTAEETHRLISAVNSPRCRLHLDCKAMSSESDPVPDVIRKNAELLEHFHANDPNKQGPGFGDLDFVPIFKALREVKYDGWVSVEVFDYAPGIERLAKESIQYMQKCLAQLG